LWLAKTIYNRFIRCSRLGVFYRILAELVPRGGRTDRPMIDATHLKAHRTEASLLKRGSTRCIGRTRWSATIVDARWRRRSAQPVV
jgi:hypothetical protein